MCQSVEEYTLLEQDLLNSVKGGLASTYRESTKKRLRKTLGQKQHSLYVSTPKEATIKARLIVKGVEADWIVLSMAKFKAGTQKALGIAKQGETSFTTLVKTSMSIIGNNRYARGSAKIVEGVIKSVEALQKHGLDVSIKDIELGDWYMLQSIGSKWDPSEKGNRNIRLLGKDYVEIVVYNRSSWKRIRARYRASDRYREILEHVANLGLNNKLGYVGRLVLLDYLPSKAYCELQISIPWTLYIKHLPQKAMACSNNICGIDANLDRINLAIVSNQGILLDTFTFRFPKLKVQGIKREARITIMMDAVHKILSYAVNHGCSMIVVENPEALGFMKWTWIRKGKRKSKTWNRRVSLFNTEIVERIIWRAPRYGLEIKHVNPAYTSKLAELICAELGLDNHTASAYIIALEYLGLNPKEAYKNLKKP